MPVLTRPTRSPAPTDTAADTSGPPDLRGILESVLRHVASSRWHLLDYVHRIPRRGPREVSGIHPSEIKLHMRCARSAAYAMMGADRSRSPVDRRSTVCFGHGDAVHLLWQAYLLTAIDQGWLSGGGAEVPVAAGHIVGTLDFEIGWHGRSYVVEIKSAGPSTYYGGKNLTSSVKAMTRATPEHVEQATAYAAAIGAAGTFFLYHDKALDDFSVFYVEAGSPQDPWSKVAVLLSGVSEMVKADKLPQRAADMTLCTRCDFKPVCLGPDVTATTFGFDLSLEE